MKKYLVLIAMVMVGCNLFSPFAPSDTSNSADQLIIEGKDLFGQNRYGEAAEKFKRAADRDASKSEAWFWHAKSTLRRYGVTAITVKKIIDDADGELDYVPLVGAPLSTAGGCDTAGNIDDTAGCVYHQLRDKMDELDDIYYPNYIAYNDLKHIIPKSEPMGIGDANDGVITYEMITYDYFLCATLVSVFQFLDTQKDTVVNEKNTVIDGDDGHIRHNIPQEWKAFTVIRRVNPNKVDLTLNDVLDISSNPFDINRNIRQSTENLDGPAKSGINMFNRQINSVDAGNQAVDNLQNTLNQMSIKMKYYFYADYTDNDFDWYEIPDSVNQRMDKMIWTDVNGNGVLDMAPATKWDIFLVYRGPVPNGGMCLTPDIQEGRGYRNGHVLYSETGYYDTRSSPERTIRFSKDSLIQLFGDTVIYDWRKNVIQLDTIRIPRVTTPLPCGEWTGGDYGVDEEMLDGKDNDGDGLSDEDTRNTKGIDDDGDWFDTDGNNARSITNWQDDNGDHFINVIHGGENYYLCAPNHRKDHPEVYQSMYNLSDKNDADKVERCKTIVYRNIGLFDSTDVNGCRHKPIPTLKKTSSNTWSDISFQCSEWKGGDWGIDEDIKDNFDNDWDMITDEDCIDPLK